MRETTTIICITLLAAFVVWVQPSCSKEIVLSAISGLVGYLARETI